MSQKKSAVLLINLGTPKSLKSIDIYSYLREFLMDKWVVELPYVVRFFLIYFIILPRRIFYARNLYRKIWDYKNSSSPLKIKTERLTQAVTQQLGDNYTVRFAMRYGDKSLSIKTALKKFNFNINKIKKLTIIPLFPIYAAATNGSILSCCFKQLAHYKQLPHLQIYSQLDNQPIFIDAITNYLKNYLLKYFNNYFNNKNINNNKYKTALIFSYHSLPNRLEYAAAYRESCYDLADQLTQSLKIIPEIDNYIDDYITAFQSQLGRRKNWIGPDITALTKNLIAKNYKTLILFCPGFVTDCLETLEEINIRLKNSWLVAGGKEFIFIPAVNNHPLFIAALVKLINNII